MLALNYVEGAKRIATAELEDPARLD